MTNYHVLTDMNRSVSVAKGQTIPVLGVGQCGILDKVYNVSISVRSLPIAGCQVLFEIDQVIFKPGTYKVLLLRQVPHM